MRGRGRSVFDGLFSGPLNGRKGAGRRGYGRGKNFKTTETFENREGVNTGTENSRSENLKKPAPEARYKTSSGVAEKRKRPVAHVNENLCIGCRACEVECPLNAITVAAIAKVDETRCTGCKKCISVCPMEAITLS